MTFCCQEILGLAPSKDHMLDVVIENKIELSIFLERRINNVYDVYIEMRSFPLFHL